MVADGGEQPGGAVALDEDAHRQGQQADGDGGRREHHQQRAQPCRGTGGPQVAVRSGPVRRARA
ncbi:hypothetical protein ACFWNF_03015 [Streptomyces anulatus]|uniref:hypothetical protein n=1 Tax=Streptomyces anulatus TaxID=1892 RepID=UPI00364C043C